MKSKNKMPKQTKRYNIHNNSNRYFLSTQRDYNDDDKYYQNVGNSCYENLVAQRYAPLANSDIDISLFNNELNFKSVACAAETTTTKSIDYCAIVERRKQQENIYENLNDLNFSKSLLLERYFNSASAQRTQRSHYENLCRGCGYGVFEAHGSLCNFCECIVNGVQQQQEAKKRLEYLNKVENIYENICQKCGLLYNDSVECLCTEVASSASNATNSLKCSQHIEKSSKLRKSKSFGKSDKKNLFQGLIGSLKRVGVASKATTRQRTEIVHNVDGFDNVFSTKETFDLQRICELKSLQSSYSDQHIYGRVRTSAETQLLSQSHDQLATSHASSGTKVNEATTDTLDSLKQTVSETQLLNCTLKKNSLSKKRIHISKPRFLRTDASFDKQAQQDLSGSSQQAIYLSANICQWLSQLRFETQNYEHAGLDTYSCDPKSIPAKQTLTNHYTSANAYLTRTAPINGATDKLLLTNVEAIYAKVQKYKKPQQQQEKLRNSDVSDTNSDEIVTLRHANNSTATADFEVCSPVDLMVQDFKRNLMAKQQQQRVQKDTMALAKQRAKRQAIYLKNRDDDDDLDDEEVMPTCVVLLHEQLNENSATAAAAAATELSTTLSTATSLKNIETEIVSRRKAQREHATTIANKRCGIHERNSQIVNEILSDFDSFLQTQSETVLTETTAANKVSTQVHNENQTNPSNTEIEQTVQSEKWETNTSSNLLTAKPNIDLLQLNLQQALSQNLNCVILFTEPQVRAFLYNLRQRSHKTYCQKYANYSNEKLLPKFQRFCAYLLSIEKYEKLNKNHHNCDRVLIGLNDSSAKQNSKTETIPTKKSLRNAQIILCTKFIENCESPAKPDCSAIKANSQTNVNNCKSLETQNNNFTTTQTINDTAHATTKINKSNNFIISKHTLEQANSETKNLEIKNSKAHLNCNLQSSTFSISNNNTNKFLNNNYQRNINNSSNNMTVPTSNTQIIDSKNHINFANKPNHKEKQTQKANVNAEEENIYQPIWKFQTIGEAQERYETDADYFYINDIKNTKACNERKSSNDSSSAIVPFIVISENVEDHSEWETDDEFLFSSDAQQNTTKRLNTDTLRSTHSASSAASSIVTVDGGGSTITNFSNNSIYSVKSTGSSLKHHLFRSIGVFYGFSEPKLRAIIYDYDRLHAAAYLNKRTVYSSEIIANDSGIGGSPNSNERSPMPPPRSSSISKPTKKTAAFVGESAKSAPKQTMIVPDSVLAWKFMLLDVNYVEDEEDVIVRYTETKLEPHVSIETANNLTLRKHRSTDDLSSKNSNEDDKRPFLNKIVRGLKFNGQRSPKNKANRKTNSTSLYVEEQVPYFPIFGAALELMELDNVRHPKVPRFVVDCVAHIEREDCIKQDGLYRASGNKVSIDELKHKLCRSFVYDPKLLITDDIHTLTSLLKQFFRELGAPLIPDNIYQQLPEHLTDAAGIECIRKSFEQMPDPNRSTLKFLIKHLTNVATYATENRMPSPNLAIVWGPCLLSTSQIKLDFSRMNTLAKVLIENYNKVFSENERLVA